MLPLQVSGTVSVYLTRAALASGVAARFAHHLRQRPWRRLPSGFGGWDVKVTPTPAGDVVMFEVGVLTEGSVSFADGESTIEARYTVRPISGWGWAAQLAAMLALSVGASYGMGMNGLRSGLMLFAVFCALLVCYVLLNWPLESFKWRRRIREALELAVTS